MLPPLLLVVIYRPWFLNNELSIAGVWQQPGIFMAMVPITFHTRGTTLLLYCFLCCFFPFAKVGIKSLRDGILCLDIDVY